MVRCMKAGGKTIKRMERGDLSMLMEIFMMDTGKMIKHMVRVFIAT